ncbi:hypothetical protein FCM35_KLT16959 [Carex littledalei]|uniref:KIB1-4 beta-propeller domain-containing protein n=1 Tax=Carex littledalei TaxID=544730 RepID=A0A833RQT6_9POAL|nr:hypothetical protein FCM35_KLT16959 [Carex littledalei]
MATKTYQKRCQKGNRTEEERDWANLPEGIVAQIGEISLAHDLLPYISLRGVCHRWRQATKNPVNTDRRFRPHNWILIDPVTNLCHSQSVLAEPLDFDQNQCLFLNFSSGKRIQVDIPELHSHCIRACVDGLLLITEIGIADTPTRLLNPFTGAMTDYPALSTLHSEIGLPLSICFASPTASTLVILARRDVAYAVPGLKEWELCANRNPLWDCRRAAHAYFHSCTCVFSVARRPAASGLELRLTRFKVEEANSGQVDLRMECTEIAQNDWGWVTRNLWGVASLVESNGELLFLSQSRGLRIVKFSFFQVFKVVIEEGVNGEVKAHLVPLNNIGKRAILINKVYGSLSVSTDVFPCIKPNSIYCYEGDSLNIYHPGGICSKYLGPNLAPPGYCYWPDDNRQFIGENLSFRPSNLQG